jgi:AcrR family transcriptional regulator
MARRMPPDRLQRLVESATEVFIALGYRRTQMSDVADALGVAKGTLYLYVESKEALFDLVVRSADAGGAFTAPAQLPVPTPPPDATLAYVRERLARNEPPAALAAALAAKRAGDVRAELERIVRQLYDLLQGRRTAIKLIDRCAHDYPDLAAVWFAGGRGQLLDLLTRYLDARMQRGLLPRVSEPALAARLIIENVAMWAVHRHWDPSPQPMNDAEAEDTVVRFVVDGLTCTEE